MRLWFAKFRFSTALDRKGRRDWPPSSSSENPGEFEARTQALHQALQGTAPPKIAPSSLHGDIMRAVRSTQQEPRRSNWGLMQWASAGGVAVLLVVLSGVFQQAPAPHPATYTNTPQAFTFASTVLDLGTNLGGSAVLLAPLTQEWERVSQDFKDTTQFVLASVP